MQSLRDAGIVLIVILLLVSVRFSPLDETGQAMGLVSLTPQVEAAPVAVPFNAVRIDLNEPVAPANAAIRSTEEQFSMLQWVLRDGEEIVHQADIDVTEHCTEVLFHLRKVAEETRNEVMALGAEEVIKVLSCSA